MNLFIGLQVHFLDMQYGLFLMLRRCYLLTPQKNIWLIGRRINE
nr:MAG TPA: hypothetical protein [Caudoviricetes sp.]